jgi:hypothetical protein
VGAIARLGLAYVCVREGGGRVRACVCWGGGGGSSQLTRQPVAPHLAHPPRPVYHRVGVRMTRMSEGQARKRVRSLARDIEFLSPSAGNGAGDARGVHAYCCRRKRGTYPSLVTFTPFSLSLAPTHLSLSLSLSLARAADNTGACIGVIPPTHQQAPEDAAKEGGEILSEVLIYGVVRGSSLSSSQAPLATNGI